MSERRKRRFSNTLVLLPKQVQLAFWMLTVVFTLTLLLLGVIVAQNRQLAKDGKAAHDVLCSYRANDIARRDRAVQLLEDQPGETIIYLGLTFPRSEVFRSLATAEAQIAASNSLGCKPLPKPTTTLPSTSVGVDPPTTTGGPP
jgi:hypothetical protein